jgi:phenylpropionate dioxygenase-like ring-hydroxylating dioxygenase large terminal subunit
MNRSGLDDQTQDYAKSPGESVQSVFARDARPPPQAWRQSSYRFLGSDDIPVQRYISPEWHAKEVEHVWRKTWQVACRVEEIPNVGDYLVYDIVDESILIVRTVGGIKAYVNACLHRGTMLCLDRGNARQLRCPFHGFTWSLEGALRYIPGQWDFPHVDRAKFSLPEVKVDNWGGFVFVNLNPEAAPLRDYLEILPDHVDGRGFENRYKAIHVSQVVPCNWKVVQEAFIEGYHVAETHFAKDDNGQVLSTDPIATFSHDTATQYDIWPNQSRHINRLMQVGGIPSQYIAHHIKSEQEIVDRMLRRVPEDSRPKLKPGESARTAIAEFNRLALSQLYRADLSRLSDSEVMDQNQYNIFPNFTLWPATNSPLCYRFRPFGNDPNKAIFEVWFLYPKPEYGEAARVGCERRLAEGDKWASVAELGGYGPIIDQDMPNLARIQKGLRATKKPGVTLANYQEVRIRHFHKTLEEYIPINCRAGT